MELENKELLGTVLCLETEGVNLQEKLNEREEKLKQAECTIDDIGLKKRTFECSDKLRIGEK